jgi:hypothetical protein
VDSSIALLVNVIPLALGAAMSPTVLTAEILILSGGPGSLKRGWALAAGRMLALFTMGFFGLQLLALLPDFSTGEPSTFEAALFIMAGVVLLAISYLEWRRRHRPAKPSKIMEDLVEARPIYIFLFGLGWMFVNISTLALYIPALHVITSSATNDVVKIIVFLILYLITSAVVLVPVLAVTFFGQRAKHGLTQVHDWVDGHSHLIVIVVSGIFGVGLIVAGVNAFLSL